MSSGSPRKKNRFIVPTQEKIEFLILIGGKMVFTPLFFLFVFLSVNFQKGSAFISWKIGQITQVLIIMYKV